MTLSSSPWMVLARVLSRFTWSYFKEQQPLLLLALAFQIQRQDRFLFSIFVFEVEDVNLTITTHYSTCPRFPDFSSHTCQFKDSSDMKFLFNPDAMPEPKKTLWSWIGIGSDHPSWACCMHFDHVMILSWFDVNIESTSSPRRIFFEVSQSQPGESGACWAACRDACGRVSVEMPEMDGEHRKNVQREVWRRIQTLANLKPQIFEKLPESILENNEAWQTVPWRTMWDYVRPFYTVDVIHIMLCMILLSSFDGFIGNLCQVCAYTIIYPYSYTPCTSSTLASHTATYTLPSFL